ncbi:MAG: deoxyribonuclease IV [Candidatus Omnitrophota bacterium]|nr:MAG: deoxyribonuclease IV [Candidatus Omnitrophota bacterium]
MLKLGVQVSSAGKIYSSVDRAKKLGCNTMQIFARNPRMLRKTSLTERDIKIFKKKVKKEKISPVVIHIPYTLNLASVRFRFYKITIKEFIDDLIEADKLGADYLVTHMGSFKGGTERRGLLRIANALGKILEKAKGVRTKILLENTSGSGRWLGYKFSHQRVVLENIDWSGRVGVCLDTAHAWAAGYKINTKGGLEKLLAEIKEEVGLERLKVVHLNDTKEKLGSRNDRHYAIGAGSIGKKGFRLILKHPTLRRLPFILETPKKSDGDDIKNLEVVKEIYNSH